MHTSIPHLVFILSLSCLFCVGVASESRPGSGACATPLPNAVTASGYCAYAWATGLGAPRGIITASNNDVIYVDQGSARVYVLWEDAATVQKAVLASAPGLNHAVQIHAEFLYASSATTVYRWAYTPGTRRDLGEATIVTTNLPCCGHTSRALAFDDSGFLYVQSGSRNNVDSDSSHSQIRRFDISKFSASINWAAGELFADGLRNEAGIRFDLEGQLWGVENGCDNLNRADLGGDIHNDNPSEELNLLKTPGKFYGYPYCWSEGVLRVNNTHPGTQWVHPDFMNDKIHSDAWCKNPSNVVVPAYNLPAHTAPLDILFYGGSGFPALKGHALISSHGSWNRNPPAGYNVLQVKFQNGMPVSHELILGYKGPGATGPGWHRPVALTVHKCGNVECILVTSDATGTIIAIIAD